MTDPARPATQLAGLTLANGWVVQEMIERPPTATGGFFSVGYLATTRDGKKAFLKALDFTRAMSSADVPGELEAVTSAFNFERHLLRKCRDNRMSRVVTALDDGVVEVAGAPFPLGRVNYLLFELADGDVRSFLDEVRRFDTAWRLRALHHVATGLRQLHTRGIAHQDLKPSNVLVYEGGSQSKVGDLGRACDERVPGPHDEVRMPGDRSYAPPEQLYGFTLPDWGARRLGCDAYHLGSLIVFFFSNVGMTAAVISRLPTDALPKNWGDGFDAVLPFLRAATEDVLQEFDEDLRGQAVSCRAELVQAVRGLCDPDPRLRGIPAARAGGASQFDLERLVTKFDLLARRTELDGR